MDTVKPPQMWNPKHSMDNVLKMPVKQHRTLSESQLETPIPHSLQLNLLLDNDMPSPFLENGIHESPLKPNPLFVTNKFDNRRLFHDTFNGIEGPLEMCSDQTEPPHSLSQQTKAQAVSESTEIANAPDSSTLAGTKGLSEDPPIPSQFSKGPHTYPTFDAVFNPLDVKMHQGETQSSDDLFNPKPNKRPKLSNTVSVCEAEMSWNDMHSNMTASQSIQQPANELSDQNPIAGLEQGQCSVEDRQFVDKVKTALKAQGKWKTANVARRSARRIGHLLELAGPPNASEALFLSGDDAAKQVECGKYFPGPIITENQQPLPLQTTTEFLDEFYDDTAKVWIQDPSIALARNIPHAREITMAQLKQRFLQPSPKGRIPWNCLEMATHVEDGLRPTFLNNEDCRLLTKLKLPGSGDSASRRGYEPGWKEVEKWALLAQGGALTEPHQDSHGYSTYITVNQGTMGFGWLSNPTADERTSWQNKAATFIGGRWRYVVLRAGQTVFFPSGTVHFVFRLASLGDTLAFGGHVLRCSQIVRWVETMLEENERPDVTNEELSVSAPAYLERVEKFVLQARKTGQVEKWGGAEAIEKFLQLKAEFMRAK